MLFFALQALIHGVYALPAAQSSASCPHDSFYTSLSRDGQEFCSAFVNTNCDGYATPTQFATFPATQLSSYCRCVMTSCTWGATSTAISTTPTKTGTESVSLTSTSTLSSQSDGGSETSSSGGSTSATQSSSDRTETWQPTSTSTSSNDGDGSSTISTTTGTGTSTNTETTATATSSDPDGDSTSLSSTESTTSFWSSTTQSGTASESTQDSSTDTGSVTGKVTETESETSSSTDTDTNTITITTSSSSSLSSVTATTRETDGTSSRSTASSSDGFTSGSSDGEPSQTSTSSSFTTTGAITTSTITGSETFPTGTTTGSDGSSSASSTKSGSTSTSGSVSGTASSRTRTRTWGTGQVSPVISATTVDESSENTFTVTQSTDPDPLSSTSARATTSTFTGWNSSSTETSWGTGTGTRTGTGIGTLSSTTSALSTGVTFSSSASSFAGSGSVTSASSRSSFVGSGSVTFSSSEALSTESGRTTAPPSRSSFPGSGSVSLTSSATSSSESESVSFTSSDSSSTESGSVSLTASTTFSTESGNSSITASSSSTGSESVSPTNSATSSTESGSASITSSDSSTGSGSVSLTSYASSFFTFSSSSSSFADSESSSTPTQTSQTGSLSGTETTSTPSTSPPFLTPSGFDTSTLTHTSDATRTTHTSFPAANFTQVTRTAAIVKETCYQMPRPSSGSTRRALLHNGNLRERNASIPFPYIESVDFWPDGIDPLYLTLRDAAEGTHFIDVSNHSYIAIVDSLYNAMVLDARGIHFSTKNCRYDVSITIKDMYAQLAKLSGQVCSASTKSRFGDATFQQTLYIRDQCNNTVRRSVRKYPLLKIGETDCNTIEVDEATGRWVFDCSFPGSDSGVQRCQRAVRTDIEKFLFTDPFGGSCPDLSTVITTLEATGQDFINPESLRTELYKQGLDIAQKAEADLSVVYYEQLWEILKQAFSKLRTDTSGRLSAISEYIDVYNQYRNFEDDICEDIHTGDLPLKMSFRAGVTVIDSLAKLNWAPQNPKPYNVTIQDPSREACCAHGATSVTDPGSRTCAYPGSARVGNKGCICGTTASGGSIAFEYTECENFVSTCKTDADCSKAGHASFVCLIGSCCGGGVCVDPFECSQNGTSLVRPGFF